MTMQEPVSLEHHLSATTHRRKENLFKLFYRYHEIPGLIDVSGGHPHTSLYPVNDLAGDVAAPNHLIDAKKADLQLDIGIKDLAQAQQYGTASGFAELQDWIKQFMNQHVSPATYVGGYRSLVTTGSTDSWHKILQVLSNEWKDTDPISQRQGVVVEEFTYALATETANVRGLNVVPIEMDRFGMKPESLRNLLANWDSSKGQRPHLMYTVSVGQNPTGATVPLARRREIYDICCKYDVVIVEDEPYWFMQYEGNEKSYLSIDYQGRVLRLDSLSKSFAPGTRLGWISGQPAIIQRLYYQAEESTMHPSGFSQVVVYNILKQWGLDGWMDWLNNLKNEYKERRDLLVDALEPYKEVNGTQVLDFTSPQAGMFLWFNVRFDHHPLSSKFSELEFGRAFWVYQTERPNPTLMTPGYFFAPVPGNSDHTARFFRLSFSGADKDILDHAGRTVGTKTAEFWGLNEQELQKLIHLYPKDI